MFMRIEVGRSRSRLSVPRSSVLQVTSTWLDPEDYLEHLRRESARFREVLASCDPAARVPSCPDWDAGDLVWHLAEVQLFWSRIVRLRPATPDDVDLPPPERPATYAETLEAFDDFSRALVTELDRADPAEPAWHWSGDHRVVTSHRRQAHEALIHRLDAEQTAGVDPTPLDPRLAADGVHEALDVMYGGEPPEHAGFEATGGLVAVELGDTGDRFLVEPGRITDGDHVGPHLVVRASGDAAATVRGTAADVDAWLWHRVPRTVLETEGDRVLVESFEAAVSPPLD